MRSKIFGAGGVFLIVLAATPAGAQLPDLGRLAQIHREIIRTPTVELPAGGNLFRSPSGLVERQLDRLAPGKLGYTKLQPEQEKELTAFAKGQLEAAINPAILSSSFFDKTKLVVVAPNVIRSPGMDGSEIALKAMGGIASPLKREGERYVGAVLLGVSEIGGNGQPRTFADPIHFEIISGQSDNPVVTFPTTGPPFQRVPVSVSSVAETVVVKVSIPFDPAGLVIELPVEPSLAMGTTDKKIDALGFGVTNVWITALGLTKPEGRQVMLSSDPAAHFTDPAPKLDAHGNASTQIRSAFPGDVTLSASIPGMQPAAATINFAIPLFAIGAILIGALAGALAAMFTSGEKSLGRLTGAVLSGVIIGALYAVGVNLTSVQPTVTAGYVLAFAIAAVGGFGGGALLRGKQGG